MDNISPLLPADIRNRTRLISSVKRVMSTRQRG